jgi:hypothetical protein
MAMRMVSSVTRLQLHRARAERQERVFRQALAAVEGLDERGSGGGVPHHHGADQLTAADDELAVGRLALLDHLDDPVRLEQPVEHAEGRHLDAGDLEARVDLRAQIARARVRAGEDGREHVGLLPGRGDEPVGGALVLGALADRVDARRLGGERVVDHDAAVHEQAGGLADLDPRAHPAGHHQEVCRELFAAVEHDALDALFADDALDRLPGAHEHPGALHVATEHLAGRVVELGVHQPVGEVDHRDVQAAVAERLCGLEAEQPAAEHHRSLAGLRRGVERLGVVERAVDEHSGLARAVFAVRPLDAREDGGAARGDHRDVVGLAALRRLHQAGARVEPLDAHPGAQHDAVLLVPGARLGEDGLWAAAAEELAELDAVVGPVGLVAVDGDREPLEATLGEQAVEQAAGRHAVADDCELLLVHRGASLSAPALTRTAQTLNSGMRLVGSSTGLVSRLADCAPPK